MESSRAATAASSSSGSSGSSSSSSGPRAAAGDDDDAAPIAVTTAEQAAAGASSSAEGEAHPAAPSAMAPALPALPAPPSPSSDTTTILTQSSAPIGRGGAARGGPYASTSARFDRAFWFGDLNYRINGNREAVAALLKPPDEKARAAETWRGDAAHWEAMRAVLLHNDQLSLERAAGHVFDGYREAPITFRPTYKFSAKGEPDQYDLGGGGEKARIPSYTDRILWRAAAAPAAALGRTAATAARRTSRCGCFGTMRCPPSARRTISQSTPSSTCVTTARAPLTTRTGRPSSRTGQSSRGAARALPRSLPRR